MKKILSLLIAFVLVLPFAVSAQTVLYPNRGGTGQSSYSVGDILYASASGVLSKLGIGSTGNVLKVSGGLPVWGAVSGGGGSISTSTAVSAGNVAIWTGSHTLGQEATGTLTESVTGLQFDNTRALLGGSAALSLTSGYFIATTTRAQTWDSAYTNRITTANSPLSISSNAISLSTAGTWSGNAVTATALAANGANCSAGSYPLGVNASGAVENCTVANTGTVTSVAMSVPTGLSISGTPITTSGTLTLTYASGYAGVLTASTSNWNTFYKTPSNRITAGTNLSWSGNTLNATGGGSSLWGSHTTYVSPLSGLYASAPYFSATSTNGTSTFAGAIKMTTPHNLSGWNSDGGMFDINNSTSNGTAFKIYSDSTQYIDSPLLFIEYTGNRGGANLFRISSNSTSSQEQIRLDGLTTGAELYETDEDNAHGKGVWEWHGESGLFGFNSRNHADTTFMNVMLMSEQQDGGSMMMSDPNSPDGWNYPVMNSRFGIVGIDTASTTNWLSISNHTTSPTDGSGTPDDDVLVVKGSNGHMGLASSSPSRRLTVGGAGWFGGDLTVTGTTTTRVLCLTADTCRTTWPTGGSGTPAGSNTFFQYNNSGSFGASDFTDNALRWMTDTGVHTLLVGTSSDSQAHLEVNNKSAAFDSDMIRVVSNSESGANADLHISSPDADIELCNETGGTAPAGCFEMNALASNNELYITPRNGSNSSYEYPALTVRRDPTTGEGSVAINAPYDHSPDGSLEIYGTSTIPNLISLNSLRSVTGGNIFTIDASGAMKYKPNGSTIYFGDYGSGNNVRVGEYNASDTDILDMWGASGTRIADASTLFFQTLNNGIALLLGKWDFSGATVALPSGSSPTLNAVGGIAFDTTDNQLLIGTSTSNNSRVVRTVSEIYKFSIGSTSPSFVSGKTKQMPIITDGYRVTNITCNVEGGTNKAITIYGETLTCLTSATQDDGSISSSTVPANGKALLTIGATSGTVNYLNVSIKGIYTRE